MESITAVEFFKDIHKMQENTSRAIDRLTSDIDRLTGDAEERKREIDRMFREMDTRWAASREELAAAHKKTEKAQARTQEIVGNLGGRFGVLVEQLLIPGICPLMNTYGHNFTTVVPSMTLLKKRVHTQIDLMLYNTTEAMAVEIKAKLDSSDVAYHIERLKKLRKIENSIFIKGLTLLGAVAAIVIDDRAKKLALDNGLYVIKIREDKDKLTADKPKDGKIGKW